ncbi:MAG: hypothetical protein E6G74_23205 [Alphaproteobacteria bacterium]|nr:MAG: hypothetical protein E6G74_23205 [Alphaproteobacteria bacterium]
MDDPKADIGRIETLQCSGLLPHRLGRKQEAARSPRNFVEPSMRVRRSLSHVVLTLAIVSLPSLAAAQYVTGTFDWRIAFSNEASPGMRLEAYVERMRTYHRRRDLNVDDVVSNADLEQYLSQAAASSRASAIGELLRYDLDGDGVVTRAEVVQRETQRVRFETRENPALATRGIPSLAKDELWIPQRIDDRADFRMRADLNKDGRIDWPEMLAFAKPYPQYPIYRQDEPIYRMIMSFDEDGDGAVTIEEFEQAAKRVFHFMDVNKDGTLSKNEIDAFRPNISTVLQHKAATAEAEKRMHERQAKTKQSCAMPQLSAAATVLLLEARADALSTATIGAQWIATEAGSIDIEPGTSPLYVVISSHNPVIWQLSGAVDRIERLVLAGESTGPNQKLPEEIPLIGATGVPAERIVFLGQPGCMKLHAGSVIQDEAAAAVRRVAGREPVLIKPQSRKASDAASLPHEITRFHRGGIVEIDPRTVIASRPVERYEVMPQEAGLIQLERDGAITRNGDGEFLVHKKIRFPAGLFGPHVVRFRIEKGVAMPEGDPGRSCVIVEDTGMMLYNGATCHEPQCVLGSVWC